MQCECAVLPYVACRTVNSFTFSHKQHDFRKKNTGNKMCVFIVSISFFWKFSHYKETWDRRDKVWIGIHVKSLLLMADLNENWIFSTDIPKIPKRQIQWKSIQWKKSCTNADGQKDRQKWRNYESLLALLRTSLKTTQSVLHREVINVCSQIHTKHTNTLYGQNVELLNVKLVVHIVTSGL